MTSFPVLFVPEDACYVFECPHCGVIVQVLKNEVNCQIFRHAVLKSTNEQINPHTPKARCDQLAETGQIYGCGKPFRLFFGINGIVERVEPCGYI